MKRTKIPNDMSADELKSFCRLVSGIFLIIWPYFAYLLTSQSDILYNKYILVLSAITEVICLISFIFSYHNSLLFKSFYWGCTTIILLVCCNFYLAFTGSMLNPNNIFSEILILINPVIIIITLLFRRILLKNSEFINAIKIKKHRKYIISDLILALLIGLIVIFISELFDSTSLINTIVDVDTVKKIIFGYLLIVVSGTAFVYGLAFYFYEARFRNINR